MQGQCKGNKHVSQFFYKNIKNERIFTGFTKKFLLITLILTSLMCHEIIKLLLKPRSGPWTHNQKKRKLDLEKPGP